MTFSRTTLVWNFYASAIVGLCLLLSNSCGPKNDGSTNESGMIGAAPSSPEDDSRFSDEEYDALLAVMRDGPIVVKNKTDSTAGHGDLSDLTKNLPGLPVDAVKDFERKNASGTSVECRFPADRSCTLLTDEDIHTLGDFKHGQNATEKWNEFRSRYGTDRYYSVSRVGFSKDGSQALAYAIGTCGTLCRDYTYYYLVKENGTWKVVKRLVTGLE